MPVSQWCYQCGRQLKVIGQFNLNGKIRVKFVIGPMVGFDPSIISQSDRTVRFGWSLLFTVWVSRL